MMSEPVEPLRRTRPRLNKKHSDSLYNPNKNYRVISMPQVLLPLCLHPIGTFKLQNVEQI